MATFSVTLSRFFDDIYNTANVEAKDLLYTSISKPLAEAGYYVISPHLAMDVLKAESAHDTTAIVTATTDHIVAARAANNYIFNDIPRGKYHPMYDKDQNIAASQKDISARVK